MKLQLIRYNTMNSWNGSTSFAYNLKFHKVIPHDVLNKVYELYEEEGFYDDINELIREFDETHDYKYQAGFNGRSGGYLVLYHGGYTESIVCKAEDFKNKEYKGRIYSDYAGRWLNFKEAKEHGLIDKKIKKVFTNSGQSIDDDFKDTEEGKAVLKDFERLAKNIVQSVIDMAQNTEVVEETILIPKKIKTLKAM